MASEFSRPGVSRFDNRDMGAPRIRCEVGKPLAEQRDIGHNRWHPDIPPLIEIEPGGRGNSRITRLRRRVYSGRVQNQLHDKQDDTSDVAFQVRAHGSDSSPSPGRTGGGTPEPRYSRVIPAVSGGRETQETGTYRLHAEVADHAQQHGEDRETLGSNHTRVLTFKTVAF